jgi:hypothetical protein
MTEGAMPPNIPKFSDMQMGAIMSACGPIHVRDRSDFLTDVGRQIQGRENLTHGELIAILQFLQRQYLADEPVAIGSKWSG